MKSNEWIKAWRKHLGLTQVQLAKKLKVQQSTIVRYESGNHVPLLGSLENIARVFGVTIDLQIRPRKGAVFGPPPPKAAAAKGNGKAEAAEPSSPEAAPPPAEADGEAVEAAATA